MLLQDHYQSGSRNPRPADPLAFWRRLLGQSYSASWPASELVDVSILSAYVCHKARSSVPAKEDTPHGHRRSPGADPPPTESFVRGQPVRAGRQPPYRKLDGPSAQVRAYLRTPVARRRLARNRVGLQAG